MIADVARKCDLLEFYRVNKDDGVIDGVARVAGEEPQGFLDCLVDDLLHGWRFLSALQTILGTTI